jgi:hypothetical protein
MHFHFGPGLSFGVIAALCLVAAGCANPSVGAGEKIALYSEPPGATARTNYEEQQCVTPCEVSIGRKVSFDVTFSLDGYKPQTVAVLSQPKDSQNAEIALFALTGGVAGVASAAMNGYTLEHKPNPVAVTLLPASAPVAAKPAGKARARKVAKTGDKVAMRDARAGG